MNFTSKSLFPVVLLGLLGLILPGVASADSADFVTVIVDGTSYDIATFNTTFAAAASTLEETPWFGNEALATELAAAVGPSLGFGILGPLFSVAELPFGSTTPLGPCFVPEGCNTGQVYDITIATVQDYIASNSGELTYAVPESVVGEPEPGTLIILGFGLLVGMKRYLAPAYSKNI